MNKFVKSILVVLNLLMLILSVYWYTEEKKPEPLIVMLGQIAILLTILFEDKISSIRTKNVSKSKVKVDSQGGSRIHTSNIRDSEIDIKKR